MRCVVLLGLLALGGAAACAQTVADSMRLGYTGTVTRYGSLSDALAGVNGSAPASLGDESRDFYLRFHQGDGTPALQLGTSWFLTSSGPRYGDQNPNNINAGFVQLYDATQSSLTNVEGKWDDALTSFSLGLSGTNALDGVHPVYNTRLWNTTDDTGQGGTFLSYDFAMSATGMGTAQWDEAKGMYLATGDPTAVNGYFRGIFQNTSEVAGPIGTQYQGYYAFDFALNLDNWASQHAGEFTPTAALPANGYQVSTFGAAIPEPSTYALLLGLGTLAAAAVVRWRRAPLGG